MQTLLPPGNGGKGRGIKSAIEMANPDDVIPLREALHMEILVNQALIDILVEKGILTQEEPLAKIEEIRKKMPKGNY